MTQIKSRKTFASIMMVSLILLSGCSGFLPAGGNNPGSGTPTAEEPTKEEQIIPGVTQNSVNIEKLASGHRNSIQSKSFTFERAVQLSEKQGAGQKVSIKYEPKEGGFESFSKTSGRSRTTETYYSTTKDGTTMFTKVNQNNQTVYRGGETKKERTVTRVTQSGFLLQWGSFFTYEVTENKNTVVLTSDSIKNKKRLAKSVGLKSVKSASLKITVNKKTGAIQKYEMNVKSEKQDISLTGTFTKVGQTTVDKPSWYDTAKKNAIKMSVSASEDNTHLVVDYSQGTKIPKGSILYLGSGDSGLTQVGTSIALEPGNTYYIVPAQSKDGKAKIVAEKPSGDLNKLQHKKYFVAVVGGETRILYYRTKLDFSSQSTEESNTTDSHDGHEHTHTEDGSN